jgi:hypothetical protein
MATKKQTAKIAKVMGEFKDKGLHSGKGGPVVKDPKPLPLPLLCLKLK